MKKNFLLCSLGLFLLIGNTLFAHGDDDHKVKKQQDTAIAVQDSLVTEEAHSQHHHSDMEMGLMITESEVVDAAMSDFSNLHPLVVHFPIVLLLIAFLTQMASFFLWKKQLNWTTLLLLLGGFLGAYVASTLVHPHTTGLTEAASLVLEKHDAFADYTMWLSGIGLLLKTISLFFFKDKVWFEIIIALALAGAAFSVSKAGHYGATLAHIHGVGVQGNFIESHDGQKHSH